MKWVFCCLGVLFLSTSIVEATKEQRRRCPSSSELTKWVTKNIRNHSKKKENFPNSVLNRELSGIYGGFYYDEEDQRVDVTDHRLATILRLKKGEHEGDDWGEGPDVPGVNLRFKKNHLGHLCILYRNPKDFVVDIYFMRGFKMDRFGDSMLSEKVKRILAGLPHAIFGWFKPSAKIAPLDIELSAVAGLWEVFEALNIEKMIPREIRNIVLKIPENILQEAFAFFITSGIERIKVGPTEVKLVYGIDILEQFGPKKSIKIKVKPREDGGEPDTEIVIEEGDKDS